MDIILDYDGRFWYTDDRMSKSYPTSLNIACVTTSYIPGQTDRLMFVRKKLTTENLEYFSKSKSDDLDVYTNFVYAGKS